MPAGDSVIFVLIPLGTAYHRAAAFFDKVFTTAVIGLPRVFVMPEKRVLTVLWKLLLAALGAVGLWLFFRWILPWVLPFLIALLIAKLMEPIVRMLTLRAKMPRWIAAALMTLLVVGAVGGLVFWGLSRLVFEARTGIEKLPALIAQMPGVVENLRVQLENLFAALPEEMRDFLYASLERLLESGAGIPGVVYAALMRWITALAGAFPAVMLFLATSVLSTYFISSDYPRVVGTILGKVSETWRERALEAYRHLVNTAGKWLRAQGLLALFTLGAASVGLLILRVEVAGLVALVIACVDALPVLGAGLTLLPWALYCLFAGETARGLGLVILYAAISLTRGFLEPKLVGGQIGLHPLVMLLSMYVGFQMVGVAGMVLFPLVATIVKQLHVWDYLPFGRQTGE